MTQNIPLKSGVALASVAQLVRWLSERFDSWSGHIPRLRAQSPVRACMRGNQLMFLSHTNVSFPLSLPPFPSLQSVSMSSDEDKNKVG